MTDDISIKNTRTSRLRAIGERVLFTGIAFAASTVLVGLDQRPASADPVNHHNASVACVGTAPVLILSATQDYSEWGLTITTDTGWVRQRDLAPVGEKGSVVKITLPSLARQVTTVDGDGNPPVVLTVPNCALPTTSSPTPTSPTTTSTTSTTIPPPIPGPPNVPSSAISQTTVVAAPTVTPCVVTSATGDVLVVCGATTLRLPETGANLNFIVALAAASLMLGCLALMVRHPRATKVD